MNVTVCIATYRRAERLDLVLQDLKNQTRKPDEIVVVDNDVTGSARAIVELHRQRDPALPIHYEVQPERNIALTRNRTVALATGDWLAFIDDDERAPLTWLEQLLEATKRFNADSILAPVIPVVPDDAPHWIKRGRFYDFARMASGDAVPLNRMRFGNAIIRGEWLRNEPGPFDVNYGLTTGEDADLLIRLVHKGAKVIWDDAAIVLEPVEKTRLSFRWLLQRALSGGQEFARKTLAGRYGPVSTLDRTKLLTRALLQMMVGAVLSVLTLPFGRHRAASWLVKSSANLGKLSVFWGWTYREYA